MQWDYRPAPMRSEKETTIMTKGTRRTILTNDDYYKIIFLCCIAAFGIAVVAVTDEVPHAVISILIRLRCHCHIHTDEKNERIRRAAATIGHLLWLLFPLHATDEEELVQSNRIVRFNCVNGAAITSKMTLNQMRAFNFWEAFIPIAFRVRPSGDRKLRIRNNHFGWSKSSDPFHAWADADAQTGSCLRFSFIILYWLFIALFYSIEFVRKAPSSHHLKARPNMPAVAARRIVHRWRNFNELIFSFVSHINLICSLRCVHNLNLLNAHTTDGQCSRMWRSSLMVRRAYHLPWALVLWLSLSIEMVRLQVPNAL